MRNFDRCGILGCMPHELPFGYEEDHPFCFTLKRFLDHRLDYYIQKGCQTFLTQMRAGPELWAAEILQEKRLHYPEKRLQLLVITTENQHAGWPEAYQDRYFEILIQEEIMQLNRAEACRAEVLHANNLIYVGKREGLKNPSRYDLSHYDPEKGEQSHEKPLLSLYPLKRHTAIKTT